MADAPLTGSNTATAGGTEGGALTSALSGATFTDANPGDHTADMTATIARGDNTTSAPGVVSYNSASGVYTVSGSHTYAEEGTWPISILVSDDGGSIATIIGSASVVDAPLAVGPSLSLQAVAGHTLAGVTIATFNDQGGREAIGDYSASIDWGDQTTGSQAAIVANADGSFSVDASHVYATLGDYSIRVAITHENGVTAAAAATAVVYPSLLVLNPRSQDVLDVSGGAQLQLGGGALTPNELYVQAVYQNVLSRPVESAALQFWSSQLDGGLSRQVFVNDIDHSGEYFSDLVESIYRQYLNRAADASGLAFWVARLQAGLSDAQFQAAVLGSPEFYQDAGGTDLGWIDSLYETLFNRPADAQGEAFWMAKLAAGAARAGLALDVTSSAEHASEWLADEYIQNLGRPIDRGALIGAGNALAGGLSNSQFLAYLLASDEFFNLYSGE